MLQQLCQHLGMLRNIIKAEKRSRTCQYLPDRHHGNSCAVSATTRMLLAEGMKSECSPRITYNNTIELD